MKLYQWIVSRFKKSDKRDVYHTDIKDHVEKAFKHNGIQYYTNKGKHLLDMSVGRYSYINFHLEELENRMTNEDLKKGLDKLADLMEGDTINIGKIFIVLNEMRNRVDLLPDPEIYYRLASIMYFDESEDLDNYDYKYNNDKIKSWKEGHELGFFLQMPMSELLPQGISSSDDLKTYFEDVGKRAEQTLELMQVIK